MLTKALLVVMVLVAVLSLGKTKLVFWQFMMDDALAKEYWLALPRNIQTSKSRLFNCLGPRGLIDRHS
jgi:hypothetical protein